MRAPQMSAAIVIGILSCPFAAFAQAQRAQSVPAAPCQSFSCHMANASCAAGSLAPEALQHTTLSYGLRAQLVPQLDNCSTASDALPTTLPVVVPEQCQAALNYKVLEDVWQSKISLKSSAPAGCTGIQYTGFVNLPQHDVNDYTSDRPSWVSSSFRVCFTASAPARLLLDNQLLFDSGVSSFSSPICQPNVSLPAPGLVPVQVDYAADPQDQAPTLQLFISPIHQIFSSYSRTSRSYDVRYLCNICTSASSHKNCCPALETCAFRAAGCPAAARALSAAAQTVSAASLPSDTAPSSDVGLYGSPPPGSYYSSPPAYYHSPQPYHSGSPPSYSYPGPPSYSPPAYGYSPPSYSPPGYSPPAYGYSPPSYSPPAYGYSPPSYSPPAYGYSPPSYSPPSYSPPSYGAYPPAAAPYAYSGSPEYGSSGGHYLPGYGYYYTAPAAGSGRRRLLSEDHIGTDTKRVVVPELAAASGTRWLWAVKDSQRKSTDFTSLQQIFLQSHSWHDLEERIMHVMEAEQE